MKRLGYPVLVLMAAFLASTGWAKQAAVPGKNHWLMVVTTNNADPAKDREFNEWYDNIDIPDMLTVPGFVRTRRGAAQDVPGNPTEGLRPGEGRYVAIYDIETDDIDKTIVAMRAASRKMEASGRESNLLVVIQAAVYRQIAPTYEAPAYAATADKHTDDKSFIYLVNAKCCRDEFTEKRFNSWYEGTHLPDITQASGFKTATRYRLYQVLLEKDKPTPNFLALYEVRSASAPQAVKDMYAVGKEIVKAGRMSDLFVEGGSTWYLQIKDVNRNNN